MELDEMIMNYKRAMHTTITLRTLLKEKSDGHLYFVKISSFHTTQWQLHHNEFSAQMVCSSYNGDNGFVDVYTTNGANSLHTEGSILVVDMARMHEEAVDDFSLTSILNDIK